MTTNLDPGTSAPRKGDLRALLLRHHARLEEVFDALLNAFAAGARDDLHALWKDLDDSLTAHMAIEEKYILPAFAKVEPHEAADLLREHAALRAELLELGVCVDLHLLSDEVASRFIARLRDHAHREDALLYRWATSHDHRESIAAGDLLRALRSSLPTHGHRVGPAEKEHP